VPVSRAGDAGTVSSGVRMVSSGVGTVPSGVRMVSSGVRMVSSGVGTVPRRWARPGTSRDSSLE